VVHPGATAASRRYPPERFGIAAQRIAEEAGAAVVFTGGADEAAYIEAARTMMKAPSLSFAGQLSLGELAALIARAAALVANNSGPVHLAAALATPVVDLYALTNPQHTPWLVAARVLNQDVPCRNCLKSICPQGHHQCLLGVPAQAVADATLDLIGGRP
jgi:ADP-heptose:LPS heptosyltransferase